MISIIHEDIEITANVIKGQKGSFEDPPVDDEIEIDSYASQSLTQKEMDFIVANDSIEIYEKLYDRLEYIKYYGEEI